MRNAVSHRYRIKNKYAISYPISLMLMALVYLSLFNNINKIVHLIVLLILVIVRRRDIPIKKIFLILIIDIIVVIMFIEAGNFGNGFNDPLPHVIKFYNITQAYLFYLIIEKMDVKYRKKIIRFGLICFFLTVCISLYYNVFIDQMAIRYRPNYYKYICTFGQYYSGVFILASLVCNLLQNKNTRKLSAVGFITVMIIFYIVGNLVTGLVLAICGMLLAILFSKTKKIRTVIIGSTIMVLVTLSIKSWLVPIIYKVSEWSIFNDITSNKIEAIGNFFIGNGQIDTIGRRNKLASFSVNSFLNNPYFGIGYEYYGYGTVGAHQEWTDLLAVFGIIGTIIIAIALIGIFKSILGDKKNQLDRSSFIISVILLIILGFLNPSLMEEVLISALVIAPNISIIVKKE